MKGERQGKRRLKSIDRVLIKLGGLATLVMMLIGALLQKNLGSIILTQFHHRHQHAAKIATSAIAQDVAFGEYRQAWIRLENARIDQELFAFQIILENGESANQDRRAEQIMQQWFNSSHFEALPKKGDCLGRVHHSKDIFLYQCTILADPVEDKSSKGSHQTLRIAFESPEYGQARKLLVLGIWGGYVLLLSTLAYFSIIRSFPDACSMHLFAKFMRPKPSFGIPVETPRCRKLDAAAKFVGRELHDHPLSIAQCNRSIFRYLTVKEERFEIDHKTRTRR